MDFVVESFNRSDLVRVTGRIDSSNAGDFDKKLKSLYEAGHYNLALDLSGIEYMSSAGVRALVAAHRDCSKYGGKLVIATPSTRMREVLDLAGLESVFQVYDSTLKAVGSF